MLKFVDIGQQTPPKRSIDQRKKDFKEIAKFYKKGTERVRDDGTSFKSFADLWELENKYLYPVL